MKTRKPRGEAGRKRVTATQKGLANNSTTPPPQLPLRSDALTIDRRCCRVCVAVPLRTLRERLELVCDTCAAVTP